MKSMAEGLQLITEGSPASLSKAIEKFESARVLMHSLNNTLGEAALLSITGSAHFCLGSLNRRLKSMSSRYLSFVPPAIERRGRRISSTRTAIRHFGRNTESA
jgi:hypothetical protein